MDRKSGRKPCSTYFDVVKDYRNRYPALQWLIDFHKAPEFHKTRLAVLEFRETSVTDKLLKDAQDLREYWKTPDDTVKGRLYILEDLSVSYIEALGSHFNLDPSFFVTYLFAPVFSRKDEDGLL